MNRRYFLTSIGVSAGVVIIPSALYLSAPGIKAYAIQILRKELHYLQLEEAGVEEFVNDYFNTTGNDFVSLVKWKVLYYLHSGWQNSDRITYLMKYYLLSSDFFINKMDEGKEVRYLGMFNSYRSPMPNPYSFVLYPPDEIANPE